MNPGVEERFAELICSTLVTLGWNIFFMLHFIVLRNTTSNNPTRRGCGGLPRFVSNAPLSSTFASKIEEGVQPSNSSRSSCFQGICTPPLAWVHHYWPMSHMESNTTQHLIAGRLHSTYVLTIYKAGIREHRVTWTITPSIWVVLYPNGGNKVLRLTRPAKYSQCSTVYLLHTVQYSTLYCSKVYLYSAVGHSPSRYK